MQGKTFSNHPTKIIKIKIQVLDKPEFHSINPDRSRYVLLSIPYLEIS
jgi:hypothetical protein